MPSEAKPTDLRQFVIDRHLRAMEKGITPNELANTGRPPVDEQTESSQNALAAALFGRTFQQNLALFDCPNSVLPRVEIRAENMISLSDVFAKGDDHVYNDKFLLCRTVAPSFVTNKKGTTMHLIVDDMAGKKAIPLELRFFNVAVTPNGVLIPSGFPSSLPVGTVIAAMNPWCHFQSASYFSVICANLMHFVVLGKQHPLFDEIEVNWQAPLQFPAKGNELDQLEAKDAGVKYFSTKNFEMAVVCFTKAMKATDDGEMIGRQYANRAAACLAIGRFKLALEDADRGLEVDPKNSKLIYRKAKALMALKQYGDCRQFLKKRETEIADVTDLAGLLIDAETCYNEAHLGKYDVFKMHEEAKKKGPYFENHAEFVAEDLIEIRRRLAKDGRGVIAKEDIPAGTLIMASKALVFFSSPGGDDDDYDASGPGFVNQGKDELQSAICARVAMDPSLIEELAPLDDKLEELAHLPSLGEFTNPNEDCINVTMALISIANNKLLMSQDIRNTDIFGSGLWLLPSFINHSCVDVNCVRYYLGSFMFVRTARLVKKGEELLCSYKQVIESYNIRKTMLRGMRGVHCRCRICLLDENDPPRIRKKADELFSKFMQGQMFEQLSIPVLKKMLAEARTLRQDRATNTLALQIGKMLGCELRLAGNLSEALELIEESVQAYENFGLLTDVIEAAGDMPLWHPDKQRRELWDRRLQAIFKIVTGDERLAGIKQTM